MENIKRLDQIINEMSLIYIDSKQKLSMEKKIEYYVKTNSLINESSKLFEELEKTITSLDDNINDINNLNNSIQSDLNVDHLINLLSEKSTFTEVSYVLQKLLAQHNNLLQSSESIIIDKEDIYDDEF